ncbi:MAG: TerB family tellurite resistance protein [Bacilli bacterium]|nr:TerB family tellurite resistance protein [Bacilli bacterium]
MYLSKLSKEQKKLFLELCTSLSIIDRDFKEEEKNLIDQLCEEMRIKPKYESSMNVEKAINEIAAISNPVEKKMILVELLGIAIADKKIASEEKEFMKNLCAAFKLKEKELDEAITLVNELSDTYSKFASFLRK